MSEGDFCVGAHPYKCTPGAEVGTLTGACVQPLNTFDPAPSNVVHMMEHKVMLSMLVCSMDTISAA